VEVEFHVPDVPAGSRAALGAAYRALYRTLWDEDEAMMMRRDEAAPGGGPSSTAAPLSLGSLDALRPRLPLEVEYGGRSFRVLELDGELLAHTTWCPHWRGPLEAAELRDGRITCPWHGYRFDLRSGRSCDGRGLRLAPAPRVRVDPASAEVWLAWR
jgi:nitrite reductase/ring-hydroxylating ferredoxin subunit